MPMSTPVERGCGTRRAGGVYIDMGLVPPDTPGARPVEDFIEDPPLIVSDELRMDLGVRPVGVTLARMGNTTHVIDWVGGGTRGARIGPLCPFCTMQVETANLSRRQSANRPNLGRSIAPAQSNRHLEEHISLDVLDSQEGVHAPDEIEGRVIDEGDPVTRASVPATRLEEASPEREPRPEPVDSSSVAHRDSEGGPVIDPAGFGQPVESDAAFPIGEPGEVTPIRGGGRRERKLRRVLDSNHMGSIQHDYPNHCTCQYEYHGGYPNVADFVEEVRRFGLSRRCELSKDEYALLDNRSTIMLLHPRAYIEEYVQLASGLTFDGVNVVCPKGIHDTANLDESMCAGLWWHDLYGTDDVIADARLDPSAPFISTYRRLPSFDYSGTAHNEAFGLTYQPAIFARFPIGQLVVINDPEGGHDEQALTRLVNCGLPVYRKNE